MRAKKTKTETRREQIARAAMRLLAVRGWQRVSLAAIARKVGVVPSAVYRHFSSKDEVLDAVLNLVGQSFQANIS
ncbi:MAG: helix-turn-helix domain-containing protein, partial [Limisphaerales bacterium]